MVVSRVFGSGDFLGALHSCIWGVRVRWSGRVTADKVFWTVVLIVFPVIGPALWRIARVIRGWLKASCP